MASSSITSWQIEGEKLEVVTDFLFFGLKITADGDRSHEIRRWLFLGRKAMTNLDSVLKSKDITLLTKVRTVKAVVLSVVMYRCESCIIKEAERRRIDAFELWCWRRLLRVPGTARRSNLKEINPKYSLEVWVLYIVYILLYIWVYIYSLLKRQYFGHLMPTANSLEKTDAGKDWGQKENRMTEDEMVWWHHQFNGHELEQTPGDGEGQGRPGALPSMGFKAPRPGDWTATRATYQEVG